MTLLTKIALNDQVLEVDSGTLSGTGQEVRLSPRATQVLACLAEYPGKVISREELHTSVWGGRIVTDAQISKAINEIRTALGDTKDPHEYIETLPKRGYRLLCEVRSIDDDELEKPPPSNRSDRDAYSGRAGSSPLQYRWVVGGLFVLAIIIGMVTIWLIDKQPTERGYPATSIAVLPFEDLSPEGNQRWIANGMTEALVVYRCWEPRCSSSRR